MSYTFGSPAATAPSTSFTFGGGGFGSPAQPQQQPASTFGIFGQQQQTGFGQQQAQPSSIFGTSTIFSQPAQTSAFGQPAQTGTFGQPAQTNTFGQPASSTSFSFNNPAMTSTPASNFAFGSQAQPAPTSTFGFGTGGFGSPAQPTTGFGAFGQSSGFGQQQQPTSLFGQPTQTNTFGQPAQTNTFGQPTLTSTFGQPAQTNTFGQPATSTSAFGFTNPAMSTPNTGFAFGQQAAAPASSSTFTFGSGGFGTQAPPQPAAPSSFGLFGQSGFGQSTSLFGQNTQTSAFGQPTQTNTFGQPATSTSGFGFNAPTMSSAPSTNFAFGTPAVSAPSTSFSFGAGGFGSPAQPATSFAQPTSLFGQPTQTSTFGQPAQTSTFGQPAQTSLFGQPAQTSTFGQPAQTNLFGQPAQTSTFGQPAQTNTFGQPTQTNTFGQPALTNIFSQPATSTSAFNFNASAVSAAPTTSFTFGSPATSAPSTSFSFGTGGFGTPVRPATSFGIFGQPGFGQPFQPQQQQQSLFGQPLQQPNMIMYQQQQQQVDESHAFYQSIFQCNKFGDERDSILANFNYLQACWGTGKGHYSQTFPPVTYTTSNPFYRFRTVGYSFIFTNNNEDGQVSFELKKSYDKALAEETQFISTLQNLVQRPNILFRIAGIKQIDDEMTILNVFAEDKMTLRRVPALDMAGVLLQQHFKPTLDNLGVLKISAKVKPSPEQLKRYLETAPEGMDPRVWRQASLDNPDSVNMIPIAIVGFDDLKKRTLHQETESQQHMARLGLIGEEVASLQSRHTNVTSELQQIRRKQSQLSHRLLSIVARQEMMRKQGMTFQVDEDLLGKKLVAINERLNSPTEFKGRLSELLPQIRLHSFTSANTKCTIDDASLAQIKEFLSVEQRSMKELVETVKTDLDRLETISVSMSEISSKLN